MTAGSRDGVTTTTQTVSGGGRRYGILRWFRRAFMSGLLFGLPVVFTVMVVVTVWNWIDQPLRKLFRDPAEYPTDFATRGVVRAIAEWNVAHIPYAYCFDTPGVGLVGTLAIFVLVGVVVRSYLGDRIIRRAESAVEQIPLVGTIYGALKGFGEAFLGGKHKGFQKAVLVAFPTKGTWVIGFVTGRIPAAAFVAMTRNAPADVTSCRDDRLRVLVPLTPPTTSLLLIIRESETLELAMPIEEAVKLVMSGGIVAPAQRPGLTPVLPQNPN